MVVLYWGFPGATWVALAIFIIASLTDMLETAQGVGLDIWGAIIGMDRTIYDQSTSTKITLAERNFPAIDLQMSITISISCLKACFSAHL